MNNKVNNLTILINGLRDYFKSNYQLTEAGINLNKLEPHKMLYNLLYQQIIDQYGLSEAADIIIFAECSKKDDNSSFISGFFKTPKDVDIDKTAIPTACNKEQVQKDNTVPSCSNDKVKDKYSTVKKLEDTPKTTTNTTKNEPVNNPKYYVNGKKVSKEEYIDAESKFRDLKSKYSHAFEDIFNDLFNQYFK